MSIANKCIDIDNKKKYFIQGLSVAPWNAADGQTHISICGNPWICNEKRLVLKANYSDILNKIVVVDSHIYTADNVGET